MKYKREIRSFYGEFDKNRGFTICDIRFTRGLAVECLCEIVNRK